MDEIGRGDEEEAEAAGQWRGRWGRETRGESKIRPIGMKWGCL